MTDQLIRRSDHKSVQALEVDIRAWIEAWYDGTVLAAIAHNLLRAATSWKGPPVARRATLRKHVVKVLARSPDPRARHLHLLAPAPGHGLGHPVAKVFPVDT